jgi:hypothetical protein
MANTTRIIHPFLDGFVNRTAVEDNILDGPIFAVTPRAGYVSRDLIVIPKRAVHGVVNVGTVKRMRDESLKKSVQF